MRVMNAAILSRGQQNEQIMVQGRRFLSENRLSILTAFKRSANLSSSRGRMPAEDTVEELVEAYLIAISTTLFLDVGGLSSFTSFPAKIAIVRRRH